MLGPISGQYMCYVIHLGQRLYQVLTFKKPNTPPWSAGTKLDTSEILSKWTSLDDPSAASLPGTVNFVHFFLQDTCWISHMAGMIKSGPSRSLVTGHFQLNRSRFHVYSVMI